VKVGDRVTLTVPVARVLVYAPEDVA